MIAFFNGISNAELTKSYNLLFFLLMINKFKKGLKEGRTFLQFGFLKSLGQGLTMLMPLVIAEYFEPELFGSYSLAKMIVLFFATLLINSLQSAFIVFANQEKTDSSKINKTFSAQCLFFIVSFVLFAATLGIFRRQLIAFSKINNSDIWFVLLSFLGLAIKSFLCNLFMATDERIKNSVAELLFGFFSIILVFFFHFTWELNLRTVLSIYPISAFFLLVFFAPKIKYRQLLPLSLDIGYIREMLSFTKWQLMGVAAVYFINWGDNLVLRYYDIQLGDIGIYNLAYSIFKGLVALVSTVGFYFLPFVSQNINNTDKIRNYLSYKRPRVFAIGVAGIIIATVFGWWFVSKIHSGQYKQAGPILIILIPGAICSLYNTFYLAIYNAARLNKYIQIFNTIQVTINILLSFFLIRYFGLMGAAIATVTAYVCKILILQFHFSTKVKKLLNI